MNFLIKYSILVLSLLSTTLFGQFNYRQVEKIDINKYFFLEEYVAKKDDVYALIYLPKSYKKDGNTDYTKEIQNAININNSLILPDFPIMINDNGLNIPSNRKIIFQKNSLINFKGSPTKKFQDIIKISNASNVNIINVKIQGNRNNIDYKGEWSAGISIINSENISISNAHIYNTLGDGIFIGSENGKYSSNITLENIWIDNARRNGISITSLIDGWIKNVFISNTNGTSPECGIDIEPSLFTERLQNINFLNINSFNNNNYAFVINLSAFNSNTKVYKNKVTVNLNNIIDRSSSGFIDLGFNNYNNRFTPKGMFTINKGLTYSNEHDIFLDISNKHTLVKVKKNGLEKKK